MFYRPSPDRSMLAVLFASLMTSALAASPHSLNTSANSAPRPGLPSAVGLAPAYGKLPLSFEPNRGQTDSTVQFLSRGNGYTLFLRPGEAILNLNAGRNSAALPKPVDRSTQDNPQDRDTVVLMQMVGANVHSFATEAGPQITRTNYFIGKDPARWRTGIPNFSSVKYTGVYPGIDLVYYGNQRQLEHDFILAPGASTSSIAFQLHGGEARIETASGDLVMSTRAGELRLKRPITYQEIDGRRREVRSSYKVDRLGTVRFRVGAYDRTAPLVIDPVLVYSTYLGGSNLDSAQCIAVDQAGDAYVAGTTRSPDFPLAGPYQADLLSSTGNAFVSEIKADGSALIYSTFLGGGAAATAQGIAIDATGNAYLAGNTTSTDFPTVNAFQSGLNSPWGNAFVSKISADGSTLLYSTYLGGSGNSAFNVGDEADAVAVDPAGDAFVAGHAYSSDFPTQRALQPTLNGPYGNAFVTELTPNGQSLAYSTYLGGNYIDWASGIALDSEDNAYVAGYTASSDFPTRNAIQANLRGFTNAFVSEVKAGGQSLVYSTYLGGSNDDDAYAIAVDGSGDAYVAGHASSPDFPTFNPYQGALGAKYGGYNAFVSAIKAGGAGLIYSTYLGGSYSDTANSIALNAAGNAYVAGATASSDFPTLNAFQGGSTGSLPGQNTSTDAFITQLSAGGKSLVYSSYLGGSNEDEANGVAVDPFGSAYVAGFTLSNDFPVANALQSVNKTTSSQTAFIAKIGPPSASGQPTATPTLSPGPGTYSTAQIVTISDATPNAQIYYTTQHGVTPTTNSTLYSGSFTVNNAGTVAAIAVAPGYTVSPLGRAYYGFRVVQPAFSAVPDRYNQTLTVSLFDNTPGTTFYYTTDGTFPNLGSAVYSGPIAVAVPQTISVIGVVPGYQISTMNRRTFSPPVAAPVITPGFGTYYGPQTITISDATPGAQIYYSTAYGVAPSVNSTLYTGPFTVNTIGTIAAIAVKSGYANSAIGSSYLGFRVMQPVFSTASGSYPGSLNLTLSDGTPGANIYYTTDGTAPSPSSIPYTGPIAVSTSTTIQAAAFETGYYPSGVAAATYNLASSGAPPIVAFGNSLVCGGQGNTVGGSVLGSVPASLSSILGMTVVNEGVSGNTSTQIGVRQGGIPTSVTMAGNQMPSSGAVTVSFPPQHEPATAPGGNLGAYCYPTFQAMGTHGTIAGIPGTVTIYGGVYSFTRDTPGSAIPVSPGTPFVVDQPYQNYFQVLETGRNNYGNLAQVLSDDAAMVSVLPSPKQYVVTSVINGNYPSEHCFPIPTANCIAIAALNAGKAAANPGHYVDTWTPLLNAYNPSFPLDVIDNSNGVVPSTLRAIWTGTTAGSCAAGATTCCLSGPPPAVGAIGYLNENSSSPYTPGTEFVVINSVANPGICSSGSQVNLTRGYAGSTPASITSGGYWGYWDPLHLNGGAQNPANSLGSGDAIQAQVIANWYQNNNAQLSPAPARAVDRTPRPGR